MPRFDRTGPCGCGPMTGWGRGPCRCLCFKSFTKAEEKEMLKQELGFLEQEVKAINKRLKELEK